ncbi:MAG: hypothetical protein CML17_03020 [Pusillimonas sp.]|nr:hypothetical protein [Pusillimonas sp.]
MSISRTLTLLLFCCVTALGAPGHAEPVDSPAPAARSETPDSPLTGQAWELADAAFKAYAEHDYEGALRLAGQAAKLEPQAPQLYVLQIYALQQLKRPQEAALVASVAKKQGLYRAVFTQVEKAIEPPPSPISEPDRALPAAAQPATPKVSARQRAYQKAYPLATKAYSAYESGDYKQAASLAEQAFRLAPAQGNWALLWVDSLRVLNDPYAVNNAIDTALAVGATNRQQLEDRKIDIQAFREEQEAKARAEQAAEFARRAYAAYDQREFEQAIDLARQAVDLTPDDENMQRLLTTSLAAGNRAQNLEALDRLNSALATQPDDAALLVQRAYLYQRLGRADFAYTDFEKARATGKTNPRVALDAGFAAAAAGKKREATTILKESIDAADAGKLALTPEQRLNLRENISNLEREWGGYVSAGYRGARPATSGLGGSPSAALGDAVFNTAEVFWRPSQILNSSTRVFEVYGRASNTLHDSGTSVDESFDECGNRFPADSYRSVTGLPSTVGALGLRFTPSSSFGLTFGLERRFNLGTRSRLGSASPNDCSLGIPGKEYQTAGYDGDWLAYVTYAYYKGTELRQDKKSWWRIEGYAQAGYLWNDVSADFRDSGAQVFNQSGRIKREYQFLSSELRVGKSVRLETVSPTMILYPHVVFAADWQKENSRADIDGVGQFALQGNGQSWSMGVGPGFGVRYWFRSNHYSAEKSYLDWTIQYRFNIGGGAKDRSKGLFMNLTISW